MNEEEKLQFDIESGKGDNSLDALAYKKVFTALERDPGGSLPPHFADKIVSLIQKRDAIKVSRSEIILFVAGAFFTVITLIIGVSISGFRPDFGFLKSIGEFKGLFLFAIAFVILLQWLDKAIVRKKVGA